jgi:hypothetical protein
LGCVVVNLGFTICQNGHSCHGNRKS